MPTLKELAALAKVSVSTVSKALNGAPDISIETREMILKIASEQGYNKIKKKKVAQNGFAGPTFAVVYSDITSHYYSKLLKLFDDRIAEMDGLMLAACARFDTDRLISLCQYFNNEQEVDGIICISPLNVFGSIPQLKTPMVGIAYPNFEAHPFDYICVNDGTGIYEAIEAFKNLGHTKIAYIGEPLTRHRMQFFRESLDRLGLEADDSLIRDSAHRFDQAGYEVMKEMLAEGKRPTAVFASYDDIALGAAKAIHEAGLLIPEDISIAGVDNTMSTIEENKVLSSINCHIEDQVDIALGLLLKKINEPDFTAVQNVSLRTEFVRRDTIARAKGI